MGLRVLAKGARGNPKDPAATEIRRIWGDLEVVDSKKSLRVFIVPEDIAKATPKDPAYCVFAQACRRQFHATKVLFYRSVAYIELPAEDGTRRVERFKMGHKMRDLIEDFDLGKGVVPKAGFELKPPEPSATLEAERAKSLRCRLNGSKDRRKLEGRSTGGLGQGKGKFRDDPKLIDLAVRSGTGAVQFTQSSKRPP